MMLIFLNFFLGCQISKSDHEELINNIDDAIEESTPQEDTQTPQNTFEDNTHYILFKDSPNSCLSFARSSFPFGKGSSWSFTFRFPTNLPKQNLLMKMFEVQESFMLFFHDEEQMYFGWCSSLEESITTNFSDLETLENHTETCVLGESSLSYPFQEGDRLTVSYREQAQKLDIFQNAEKIMSIDAPEDLFSDVGDTSFGCTEPHWLGGMDSMILASNTLNAISLTNLINAERDLELIPYLLNINVSDISYWNMGESDPEEEINIPDYFGRRPGLLENGAFIEHPTE